jgi:hypothetical protein
MDDILIGAKFEETGGQWAGAAYLVHGPVSGEVSLSFADAKFVGEHEFDLAGTGIAAGDVNGDGIDDLLVGACYEDTGGDHAGAAYLVLGPASGTSALSTADAKFLGEADDDYIGERAVAAGDVDGDGLADVLLGAMGQDGAHSNAGAVYVVLGPASGEIDLSSADAKLSGVAAGDWAGRSVASGDVDGDGTGDILIGAIGPDTGGPNGGAAFLVLGPVTGDSDLSSSEAVFLGGDRDFVGNSVVAGDIDGDGFDDVLLGGDREGERVPGKVFLVFGPASGEITLSAADATFLGEADRDHASWSLAAGDANGDGMKDILIGAYGSDLGGVDAGAAYLLYGTGL